MNASYIDDIGECELAAKRLSRNFGDKKSNPEFPRGCYAKHPTNNNRDVVVNFNTVLEYSPTNLLRRSICRRGIYYNTSNEFSIETT